MLCLSVRQPWAWLIVHGRKDVENRTWRTKHRGRIAVHAACGMANIEYDAARLFARERGVEIPHHTLLVHGALIGEVDIVGCLDRSDSRWFTGPIGWSLANSMAYEWTVPAKGRLGLWPWPMTSNAKEGDE